MVKIIVPAAVVMLAGVALILKRASAARGFGFMMGGTVPPVIMTVIGSALVLFAAVSIMLFASGELG